MKFIDLFAGLGGFHKALHELGHECVFASELIPALQETYKLNWGMTLKQSSAVHIPGFGFGGRNSARQ